MEKKKILSSVAKTSKMGFVGAFETSKIGFAGIFAGVFCIVFSLIYTFICYANKREK